MRASAHSLVKRFATSLALAVALAGNCLAGSYDEAATRATVLQHEQATLNAFRTHDKAAYLRLCLPSFYEITSDGTINPLQEQLIELEDYVLGEYQMEDVVVTLVAHSVALIRYKITAAYTYKGKNLPVVPVLASAVWILRDGQWRAATYQEVQLARPR